MASKTGVTTKVSAKKRAATSKAKAKAVAPAKARAVKKTAAAKNPGVVRVTLGSLSAQIAAMSTELATITQTLAALAAHLFPPAPAPLDEGAPATRAEPVRHESFETDLLATMGTLDRSGRHAGLIPIPELRVAFLERGWPHSAFDERLLQAERDFIVDLKVADDPSTLADPDLAIQERGRGYLQYVVAR